MNHDTMTRTQQYKRKHRIKSRLQKVVVVLACVVVFCTTYALILPALTTQTETFCGREEHVHTQECYRRLSSLVMTLDCEEHLRVPHTHSEECKDAEGNLICGQAEFYAHTHEEHCYNAEGQLVCKMPERSSHVHSAECYAPLTHAPEHSHSDECYSDVRGELICTLTEEEPHTHGEDCYKQGETLLCTSEEEDHVHSAECYEQVLSCGVAETPGHSHSDACYAYHKELTCGKEEVTPSEDAFNTPQTHKVICGQLEAAVHIHGETCFRTTELVLTCGRSEDADHSHTDLCYGNWELCCGIEAHTHSLSCYSNPNADVEKKADWEASMSTVKRTGSWPRDIVSVAVSQLGYKESAKNYQVMDDGTLKGYSRYGQWYGDPYGDWCAMFASFCLRYGGVKDIPIQSSCGKWIEILSSEGVDLYREAAYHSPLPGDIAFIDWDGNGKSEHVGLVAEVIYDEDVPVKVKTIEGNASNRVQYVTYDIDDEMLLGYGDVNRAYQEYRLENPIDRVYTSGDISIKVSLMAANEIPDDADLVVQRILSADQPDVYDAGYLRAQVLLTEEISQELPPVIEDYQLFDISFQKDGKRIEPVGEFKVELSYTADGELYEKNPAYVICYGEEKAYLPAVQHTSVEYDTVTTVFHTDNLNLYAVAAADVRSQSYMSRTDVTTENLDDLSGLYALISENYALVVEGTEPKVIELDTITIEDQVFIPADSKLEIWNFIYGENNSYYIATYIDDRTYYLSMENEEGSAPKLYLTDSEEERTLWLADSSSPELKLLGNGVYLEIAPNKYRATVIEPTIGLYRANEFQALFDGQFGAHQYYANGDTKYEGASRILLNCDAQNQVTIPATLDSTGAYPYQVVGWYDIVNKVYYGEEYLGTKITLTKDAIFYPDYVAKNYDIGQNVDVVKNQPRLPFVETHMFDYNELFNLRGSSYTGNVPNITTNSSTWDFNTWTVNESGFNFVLTDWIHSSSANRDGNIGRPLSLGEINSVHNDSRTYNDAGVPNFVGIITEGIFNDTIKGALFSHDDYMGRHYLGQADMLYQYDAENGFYYYNSALNAASYNQSAKRFYVYDHTVGVKNESSIHDFLPLNYGQETYDDVGSEVNFWFGMTSEITFYLPDVVGSDENVDVHGNDMQFRFSGDDDVWVFVDDHLVLDMGGVHDIVYGEVNFATGLAKTAGESAVNTASAANNYMPGVSGNSGVKTTALPDLEPGEMHTLTVYYMERGSSLSNCAIYFNLAPMYELEIIKRDKQNQNLLEGAVFEVFEDPECTIRANLMVTDEWGNTSHPTSFTTNEAGYILCSGLLAGKTYYIKETSPPTRPINHPGYPDMSKYVIQLSLGSTGKPTVILLNSENDEWIYADAHRFSETGTRVSLTVYNEASVGGDKELYVEKIWEDETPTDHDPIVVHLYANGADTGRTITLGPNNDWKGFFLNLPEFDPDGKEIKYTVKEEGVPDGYRVAYEEIASGGTVTTTTYSWEPVTALESGGTYIFATGDMALATGSGDSLLLETPASTALASAPTGAGYYWTATASGTGFHLKSGDGGYLTLYNSLTPYFYQTANATTMSVMNFQTDGKLYGIRNSAKQYFRYLENGHGEAGRLAATGADFTIYKWTAKESSTTIQADGWKITNSNIPEEETVAIPVKKIWHDNVPLNKILPIEVDLYLAPDAGGQATYISTLILNQANGWTDAFTALPAPEDGYHYYVAEKNSGFIVTYNGTVAQIQVGASANDTITAMRAEPITTEELKLKLKQSRKATKAVPDVIAADSLFFGFDTNQNPAPNWTQVREANFGSATGTTVALYTQGGNLVLTSVYNSTTIVEYSADTGYTVKPGDHFEIAMTPEGGLYDPAELRLRIRVDGTLHEIALGKVQPVSGQFQTFSTGELNLSGRVTSIGFFINGYDIYADLLKVDYMYLGSNEEPEETEPSETEPSETEPSETEPSETEPSETEPDSSDPEPSEPEPSEPTEPDDTEYDEVVITNRCATVDIPVEKLWDSVNPDIMNPISLRLYLVEEIVGDDGTVSKEVSFVQEISLSKDTQWKNTFPGVLVPDSNSYYVVVENMIPGFLAFYEGETVQISVNEGTPVTGVKVDLSGGQATTVQLTNAPATELPSTGGEGLLLYTMGGALLSSVAAVLLMYSRKNKRRKGDMLPF